MIGYPTGGYPTRGYPTGGYPTGGCPTQGQAERGRPSIKAPSPRASRSQERFELNLIQPAHPNTPLERHTIDTTAPVPSTPPPPSWQGHRPSE